MYIYSVSTSKLLLTSLPIPAWRGRLADREIDRQIEDVCTGRNQSTHKSNDTLVFVPIDDREMSHSHY